LEVIRSSFLRIKDHRRSGSIELPLADALMSGVAVFGMKYPSLLQFDQGQENETIRTNLKNLYSVNHAPCDTQMRTILDPVEPAGIRKAFKAVFAKIQDGKELQQFRLSDKSYLIAIDGTEFFSSHEVHCNNCCVRKHRNGTITYYHQMLAASLVHPSIKQVIPLAPEPIVKQDGAVKNDCERNAAKRLLEGMRRDHPHLPITLGGDGLFSTAPMVNLARTLNMGFIFVAKSGDHKSLFSYVEEARGLGAVDSFEIVEGRVVHKFNFINALPLNDTNPDLLVNVLEYSETRDDKILTYTWITSTRLTRENAYEIMRAGRARWRIENETFNTLKNQGYHFEHNFGHGNKNLSTVFAFLMMLAFLVDQAQELSCKVFRGIITKYESRKNTWEHLRSFFRLLIATSWEMIYDCLLYGFKTTITPNTS
jgi:hypothetical protein